MGLLQIEKFLSPAYTLSRFEDLCAKNFSTPSSPKKLSWELSPDLLKKTVVHWPRHYSWEGGWKWMEPLRLGFLRHVDLVTSDIEQPQGCLARILVEIDGEKFPITIDYSDYFQIDQKQAGVSLAYFKMQHHKEGYSSSNNIVPGGFLTNGSLAYHLSDRLRRSGNKRYDVYGRFSLDFARGTRREALDLLIGQKDFDFEGGERIKSYGKYLRECVGSKVCVDLPGNGEICFRLIDYLCLGCPIVSVKNNVVFPEPLVDGEHLLFCKKDLSDMLDLCQEVLANQELRNRLSNGAKNYFDSYLHREQLTCFYLSEIYKLL